MPAAPKRSRSRTELIASGGQDRSIRVWRAADGGQVAELAGPTGDTHFVAFSPSGDTLVAAGNDGKVRAWSVAGGVAVDPASARIVGEHVGAVTSIAIDGAGRYVASAGRDATITRTLLAGSAVDQIEIRNRGALGLSIDAHGHVLAASESGDVEHWAGGAPVAISTSTTTSAAAATAIGIIVGGLDGSGSRDRATVGNRRAKNRLQGLGANRVCPDNGPSRTAGDPEMTRITSIAFVSLLATTAACGDDVVAPAGTAPNPTCADVQCDAHATCSDASGEPTCGDVRDTGFAGDGLTCTDIDECATANACPSALTCVNAPGGFDCLPSTCAGILQATPGAQDGESTLYVGGDPAKSWTAFCANMATAPKEYLLLVKIDGTSNFS